MPRTSWTSPFPLGHHVALPTPPHAFAPMGGDGQSPVRGQSEHPPLPEDPARPSSTGQGHHASLPAPLGVGTPLPQLTDEAQEAQEAQRGEVTAQGQAESDGHCQSRILVL